MAPSKITDRTSPAVVPNGTPPLKASRLPPRLRLPILLVLNLGLHSIFLTLTTNFLGGELGRVSKRGDDAAIIAPAARLVYKVAVIWLGWRLNYDFIDISALTAMTNVPFADLLVTYYNITPYTAFAIILNEVLAIAIPTFLLRSRSAVNNPNAPLPNRYLLNSSQVWLSNTLLAVGVYVVVIFSALKVNFLSEFLITHFDLKTMEAAHAETPIDLAGKLLIAGLATKTFLLNSSIGATPASGDVTPIEEFDAATATLPQTLKHNLWFFSPRTRTLIKQTVVLSGFLIANTALRCLTLSGTDFVGATGYSGIWVLGITICAAWWVWVGNAEA